jgi:choline dehydrogenase-like flavoprotein
MERYDVVVAGGGPAGCVLAARLSEDADRSVCLVEAGPDYGPYGDGRWPADLLDARALALSHAWPTDRVDRSQLRARVIGGCSAHNACVVLRGSPSDYDEWGPGWTYAELEPCLERAERQLRTRRFEDDELSPWHAVFARAPGAIVHTVNVVDGVRWNAAFAYLDAARGRPNLTIRADTLADRVDVERRVLVTDRGELTADAIVLAASAYGSPAILLRSGIGPGLAHDLPVGEGLADHVGVGLGFDATERLQQDTARFAERHPVFMAQVTVAVSSGAGPRGTWDVFLFPGLDPGYEISTAVFAMKPYSRGRLSLRSPDPADPPFVDHGFLRDERDVATLAEGFEALRELARSDEARVYAARENRPGEDVDAESHVRAAARGFFHPTGTCALGEVVDREARVVGLDGIYVADASIMPTLPRANTHHSTLAVAERVAELLRG